MDLSSIFEYLYNILATLLSYMSTILEYLGIDIDLESISNLFSSFLG